MKPTDGAGSGKRPRFGTDEAVFPKSEALRLMSTASHMAFQIAEEEARQCGSATVQPAHVFIALCKLCDLNLDEDLARRGIKGSSEEVKSEARQVSAAFKAARLEPLVFRRRLRAIVGFAEDFSAVVSVDQSCPEILALANQRRQKARCVKIRLIDILFALAQQDWAPWLNLLTEMDVKKEDLREQADRLAGRSVTSSAPARPKSSAAENPESLTEAVLVMNVYGSTGPARVRGDRLAVGLKRRLKEIVAAAAAKHHANLIQATEDGFLLTFAGCRESVLTGLEILAEMRGHNKSHPDQPAVHLRFGIDFGEIQAGADGSRSGAPVDMASRIEAADAGKMHETRSGLYHKEGLPTNDCILVTQNVFKQLSIQDAPFQCLKAGYFDCQGLEGVRVAVYVVYTDS
jgi:class 3 adenylate cyclase